MLGGARMAGVLAGRPISVWTRHGRFRSSISERLINLGTPSDMTGVAAAWPLRKLPVVSLSAFTSLRAVKGELAVLQ